MAWDKYRTYGESWWGKVGFSEGTGRDYTLGMSGPILLRTRLAPPRGPRRLLERPALQARLAESLGLRLTVVQAGTGYGKTTALAALAARAPATLWYSVEREDGDPRRFLAYLMEACRLRLPTLPDTALALLQESEVPDGPPLEQVVDALINALDETLDRPTLLVLDDYHHVADRPEVAALTERLIQYAPEDLHVVLATRHPLVYAPMARWRARGELLLLTADHLLFTPDEIARLYRDRYERPLAADEVATLAELTEGWPIALHLIWQRLRSAPESTVADLLARNPGAPSLDALFEYLARDLFARQPPDLARFLTESATLRSLTADACRAVTGDPRAGTMLERVLELDLFVVALGEQHYRYHHLFHDFLRQQAAPREGSRQRHRRAAAFFEERGDAEEALYHHLSAGDYEAAATAIEQAGEATLRAGRLERVSLWLDALPAGVLAARPALQALMGDLCRLGSRFDEALAWYEQAERGCRGRQDGAGVARALRGRAQVYLDTVRPARAVAVLEEALREMDGTADRVARARLLELLAENKLNLGQPEAAEPLRAEARTLREAGPAEDSLSVRVRLRTGRLEEAEQILAGWVTRERVAMAQGQSHAPRAHRESALLLSLIHAMTGRAESARTLAQEGIALGERLSAPFVTAVGHMRLGHAHQIATAARWPPDQRAAMEDAVACYERAIDLGDRLAVRRTRAEALWGLTRAYGFAGDLPSARLVSQEGVEIGTAAGDVWIVALTELALGGALVLGERPDEAIPLLRRVEVAFGESGDQFGRTAAALWLALAHHALGQRTRLKSALGRLFDRCATGGYDFLFLRPTLLGPPTPRRLVPLLIEARAIPRHRLHAARLLTGMGMGEREYHPGFRLRVQTLGAFGVWRDETPITPREWHRDKARQLFQLLLTERHQWLPREALIERLWPERPAENALRDFKVALSALNKTLEPARAGSPPSFIARSGSAYRLDPSADLWLDIAEFEAHVEHGLAALAERQAEEAGRELSRALMLYQGPFLPGAMYEDWAGEARERALALFLRAADRMALLHFEQERYDDCLSVCDRILSFDPCWETAYLLGMRAHAARGERAAAIRLFHRGAQALRDHLDVAPGPEARALYDRLTAGLPQNTAEPLSNGDT